MPERERSRNLEHPRQHGIRDILDALSKQSPDLADLAMGPRSDALRNQLIANFKRIQGGDFESLQAYSLPEYLQTETRYYEVGMNAAGGLIGKASDHPHMPSQSDGTVLFTTGDLHAAAEWDAVPVLSQSDNQPATLQARKEIEVVKYHLALRRVYAAYLAYSEQLWNTARHLETTTGLNGEDLLDFVQTTKPGSTVRLTTARFAEVQNRSGTIAERVAFTVGARLGAHLRPSFEIYRAKPEYDTDRKIDIILRVLSSPQETHLVGFDVTARQLGAELRMKREVQMRANGGSHNTLLRDPATNKKIPAHLDLLKMPNVDWPTMVLYWSKHQLSPTETPEYRMSADHLSTLIDEMLSRMKRADGLEFYNTEKVQRVRSQLYGS